MIRPWQIWLAFGVCLAVVVAAVGWMSVRALEADEAQSAAHQQAALEANAQLALWRMDSAVAPLVAQESARPYFVYASFFAADRSVAISKGKRTVAEQIPSPLLTDSPTEVLLHFQIDSENRFSSPRVPDDAIRAAAIPKFLKPADAARAAKWLEHVRKAIAPAKLWSAVPSLGTSPANQTATTEWTAGVPIVASVNGSASNTTNQTATTGSTSMLNLFPTADFLANGTHGALPTQPVEPQSPTQQATLPQQESGRQEAPRSQQNLILNNDSSNTLTSGISVANAPAQVNQGGNEYNARSQYVSQNSQQLANYTGNSTTASGGELQLGNTVNSVSPGGSTAVASNGATIEPPAPDAQATVMKPIWIGDELILARRVRIAGEDYIQGCLLDWPMIQRQLIASVRDLLPNAALSPVASATAAESAHLLASLPLRLDPGAAAISVDGRMSPVRLSLVGAWGALMLAALAVAMLLQGVVSLSERRGAFVSAVTHELRTPLTTFRMYAEMLADNMVSDESARRNYLQTLRVEADRLTHLVENVLLYARLERGRRGAQIAPVAVSQILEQAAPRLTDRAKQANFEIAIDADQTVRHTHVRADPTAVEQILFNLVDNACKYAAAAADRTLHLEARTAASFVELRLRDHGPGVDHRQRRLLFQPFRKSAQEAARTASGVGLGLALSRRLARDMSGDLLYSPESSGGACFVLRLRTGG